MIDASIDSLLSLLDQAPVMGRFHPLLPLALPSDVVVADSARDVAVILDAVQPHEERRVLIRRFDDHYTHRFLTYHFQERPPIDQLNQFLPDRIRDSAAILCQSQISRRILRDVLVRGYQAVLFLLVDGLSYEDVLSWPEIVEPCLVDSPSITFALTPDGKVAPDIGFARIIGNPTLGRLLHEHGLRHSRGFSYWSRRQNNVSDYLFSGIPVSSVSSFDEVVTALRGEDLSGFFVQMIREGTDGLAHRRREVRASEVASTVQVIHEDLQRLVNVFREKYLKGAVYLTSDHGMLWKQEHNFQLMATPEASSPRYTTSPPSNLDSVTALDAGGQTYYLFRYPYLGRQIRSNDSGVHGGVSYFESVVPFVHVEVNP